MKIVKENIIIDDMNDNDNIFQKMLKTGSIRQIDLNDETQNKYTPDIIIYNDGPKYWVELVMQNNGKYVIETYKKIN